MAVFMVIRKCLTRAARSTAFSLPSAAMNTGNTFPTQGSKASHEGCPPKADKFDPTALLLIRPFFISSLAVRNSPDTNATADGKYAESKSGTHAFIC